MPQENLEVILLVRRDKSTPELKFVNHLEQNRLPCQLCCLGMYTNDKYTYRSFGYEEGNWGEIARRRYFSPLRFRELRIDRLSNFDSDLVYHSQYVHVMKLEAKDNNRDQRIFAFVESPETNIELDEDRSIQRIGNFECILGHSSDSRGGSSTSGFGTVLSFLAKLTLSFGTNW